MKKTLLILFISLLFLCSCVEKGKETNIYIITFNSEILKKDMQVQVYLPPEYDENTQYPVLYFLHDYGGSPHTVMEQYKTAETAQKLIESGDMHPIIIAAIDIDRSFGLNSSKELQTIETTSGKTFNTGMYEDYFMLEILPYIDNNYNTLQDKSARYIGGYSMGGFAALYLSLMYPDSFSKAGGHSPSIFIESFPDETVTDFLYPSNDIREQRDPIKIVENSQGELPSFFLDVESGGSNGVEYLYETMINNGVDAEYHVLGFSHSRETCQSNMEDYLKFYAGID